LFCGHLGDLGDPLSWENATGCFIDIGREIRASRRVVSPRAPFELSQIRVTKDLANFGEFVKSRESSCKSSRPPSHFPLDPPYIPILSDTETCIVSTAR